ncbi:MAG TPA: acyltransferase family protein [Opitutus sp.]|nr:acyltransferase family protein [Opitutus sp.]
MTPSPGSSRLDYLDATRAFALVLGVVFHASLSFLPFFIGWAVQDVSTSPAIGWFMTVSHSFRMETFFLLAGFFGCMTLHRKGVAEFIRSRAIRLGVPFVVGWFLLRPLLVAGWNIGFASMRGDYHFWAGLAEGFRSLRNLPAGIFTQTHLWFLYYLALVTALALGARALLNVAGKRRATMLRWADRGVAWVAQSPFGLLALIVLSVAVLSSMKVWGVDTPDQTLVPEWPVVLMYGGGFAFGWLLGRQPEAIEAFTRLTATRWALAVASVAVALLLTPIQLDRGHPYFAAAHRAFVVTYAVMMWSLVTLTIGVFRVLCRRPRAWVRYVADSSYWMYLIHLPLVVWLQVAVAEYSVHWSLKLAGITLVVVGAALLSYDLFVRSTFIGWVLNGRRRERVIGPALVQKLRRTRAATGRPSPAAN